MLRCCCASQPRTITAELPNASRAAARRTQHVAGPIQCYNGGFARATCSMCDRKIRRRRKLNGSRERSGCRTFGPSESNPRWAPDWSLHSPAMIEPLGFIHDARQGGITVQLSHLGTGCVKGATDSPGLTHTHRHKVTSGGMTHNLMDKIPGAIAVLRQEVTFRFSRAVCARVGVCTCVRACFGACVRVRVCVC